MKPTIRSLTAADEPFLSTALYHALHVPPGGDPFPAEIVYEPEIARYVTGWMQRPGDLGCLAEVDGLPIGAAWIRLWTSCDRGYGFVNEATPELSMSLLPGHRGQGIGSAMLCRLLSDAACEFEAVSLSVSESNPARHLYSRHGFESVGQPDGDSITMIKRFARSEPR